MQEPIFHTVREAAEILRVDAATIYRSIREGSFPAVRIRTRYVIPAAALRAMAATAVNDGSRVDLTDSTAPAKVPACLCGQLSRSCAAHSSRCSQGGAAIRRPLEPTSAVKQIRPFRSTN